jgi:hypothetical protein
MHVVRVAKIYRNAYYYGSAHTAKCHEFFIEHCKETLPKI